MCLKCIYWCCNPFLVLKGYLVEISKDKVLQLQGKMVKITGKATNGGCMVLKEYTCVVACCHVILKI